MLALRRIAAAYGMKDVVETANLNPKTLYRTLRHPETLNSRAFRPFSVLWVCVWRLRLSTIIIGNRLPKAEKFVGILVGMQKKYFFYFC